MNEIMDLVFSWQFLSLGVVTAILMVVGLKVGFLLWKVKKMRGVVRFFDALKPWIPWLIGGGLGAIPIWPRPEQIQEISDKYQYIAMIFLGMVAGALYERIWKGVKQVIEARGIDLDLDITPQEQKRIKK